MRKHISSFRILGAAMCAALGLFLSACDQQPAADSPAADGSPVLVHVNGGAVTLSEFKEEAAKLDPDSVAMLTDEEVRSKFLDNLVSKKLIIQQALKDGLDKDPEVVKRLNKVRDDLVLGLFVKTRVFDRVGVTDEGVRKYFDEHKADLGSVRISHIQVPTKEDAEELLVKFKAGEPFKTLAKEYSQDIQTKDDAGDLGFIGWMDLAGSPDFRDAAFGTPPGEVSNVVRSSFAFHIIKVTDKKPATEESFPKMKDKLKAYLAEKQNMEHFDNLVKELRDKADVRMSDDIDKELSFLNPEGAPPAE